MKKEVKRRAIECAAAAVLYIVAIVGGSYAELEREMRLLIFLSSVSDHGFCDGQAALEQSEEKKVV